MSLEAMIDRFYNEPFIHEQLPVVLPNGVKISLYLNFLRIKIKEYI